MKALDKMTGKTAYSPVRQICVTPERGLPYMLMLEHPNQGKLTPQQLGTTRDRRDPGTGNKGTEIHKNN